MSTTRVLTALLAAAVVPIAACASDAPDSPTAASDSPTAASASPSDAPTPSANGSADRDAARGWLYDTTWPVPTADTWRTSSIATGGLPDEIESRDLRAESVELGPVPIFGVTHDDAVFVLGGAQHLMGPVHEGPGQRVARRSSGSTG